jgi:hypothetical protein
MTGSTRVLRSLFDRPTRGLLPDGSVHADAMTELIRKSGYFDDKFYALADEARSKHIDPISHYVTEGEKRGFAPSEQFDPVFYKDAYPDVAAYSFVNALHHYLSYGKAEGGRLPLPIADQLILPKGRLDPKKKCACDCLPRGISNGSADTGLESHPRSRKTLQRGRCADKGRTSGIRV